jgi:glycosyltransferase involved in cell wall biosynthesis
MPAYNAARTIEQTYREIPLDLVDAVVVTDDASHDDTVEVARGSACTRSSTSRTAATAATRRPATPRRCGSAPTSW